MSVSVHFSFSHTYLPTQIEMCNGIDRTIQESFNKIGFCECKDVKPYIFHREQIYSTWMLLSKNVQRQLLSSLLYGNDATQNLF